MHGGYSLGVLAGATGGVVAIQLGATVALHLAVVATVLTAIVLVSAPTLWQYDPGDTGRHCAKTRAGRSTGPWGIPLTVAVLAVCGLLIEGLITDWSAVLISRDLGASDILAATALAVFNLAMFVSRSVGDTMLSRFGESRLLTAIAVSTAFLIIVGTLISQPWAMILAIGLTGLAIGPIFPLAVQRASRPTRGRAAAMTAQVSAVGYIAYLGGPPLAGTVAEAVGLPATFVVVALVSSTGIAIARRGPAHEATHRSSTT